RLLAPALLEGRSGRRAPLGAVLPRRAHRRIRRVAGGLARSGPPAGRARPSLLPRALWEDGEEGAPPLHVAGGPERGGGGRVLRRRGGAVAAPPVAGRQHLHGVALPGAGVAAGGGGGRARRASRGPVQLRIGLRGRVLRRARGRRRGRVHGGAAAG